MPSASRIRLSTSRRGGVAGSGGPRPGADEVGQLAVGDPVRRLRQVPRCRTPTAGQPPTRWRPRTARTQTGFVPGRSARSAGARSAARRSGSGRRCARRRCGPPRRRGPTPSSRHRSSGPPPRSAAGSSRTARPATRCGVVAQSSRRAQPVRQRTDVHVGEVAGVHADPGRAAIVGGLGVELQPSVGLVEAPAQAGRGRQKRCGQGCSAKPNSSRSRRPASAKAAPSPAAKRSNTATLVRAGSADPVVVGLVWLDERRGIIGRSGLAGGLLARRDQIVTSSADVTERVTTPALVPAASSSDRDRP